MRVIDAVDRAAARRPIRCTFFREPGAAGCWSDRGQVSLPALLFIVGVAIIAIALVVLLPRRDAGTPESATPATPVAVVPVDTSPLFSEWLKLEPAEVAGRAEMQTRFFDAVLAHQVFQFPPQGLPPMQARELLLDDDKQLFSSGRRLWNHELLHQPGMVGKFCYLHTQVQFKRLFEVQFFLDGKPAIIYDNQYKIERTASHTRITYNLGGVTVEERKFITNDDRAVATYQIVSADKKEHGLEIEVSAPYLTMPAGRAGAVYPLMGAGSFQGIPLFIYLDAPGFTRVDAGAVLLRRRLSVPAEGEPTGAQVALSFENRERQATALPNLTQSFEQHERDYNRWFADNVPYFDAADGGFKRMWYYRWWIARFNMTEADTPDLKGYRFYEGKMGFDNPITFATPAHMKELTYLRDPEFGLQQAENAWRNVSPSGAIVDPPGSPYWAETYSHWGTAALAEYHRVHPIPEARLRAMLPALAADVRAWLTTYDGDGDFLPERNRPRVTGYDLDILSYWFWVGTRLDPEADPPNMERVDFASFVYANARGVAELARAAGDPALAMEFDTTAEKIRHAALSKLWEQSSEFFYPQRADDARAPIRELHGFFPFLTQLAPDEPRYVAALKKFVDPGEFWARFPPVITSQFHYRRWTWEMDGLTRNIAPHPISMGARTLIQVLKHYRQDIVTAAHFMELMTRYNALVYPGVNPFDPYWRPNVHEYYSKWEPFQSVARPKPSDISHDFHSMYNSLIVEGVVGLTPRVDDKIELQPLAHSWPYFALHRLRHRGHDLTILWDQPDGRVRYNGFPEGFSLYIDGKQAFTRPTLGHVIYDPASGKVEDAAAAN